MDVTQMCLPLLGAFSAKTFDPPPPQKSDIQFQGIEASDPPKKNDLGDCLIGQNNEFTRGWTSNIMPWGMLRE